MRRFVVGVVALGGALVAVVALASVALLPTGVSATMPAAVTGLSPLDGETAGGVATHDGTDLTVRVAGFEPGHFLDIFLLYDADGDGVGDFAFVETGGFVVADARGQFRGTIGGYVPQLQASCDSAFGSCDLIGVVVTAGAPFGGPRLAGSWRTVGPSVAPSG